MVKIFVVGKGEPTQKQKDALRKVFGDFEIVGTTSVLQNPKEIPNVNAVVSQVLAPTVLTILSTWKKFNKGDVYVFKMEQQGEFETKEKALKHGDVVYQKRYNTGETKWVASKTVALLKNPQINITYEEEISL